MLSNELPIRTREEDFLNRGFFADHLSNAIINYDDRNHDSLTIGLYGKWGSGKTSIINMAIENLEKKENVIVFNFEPWLFSDTQQLISSFFKEFSVKIKNENINQSDRLNSLGDKLEAYASFFEPLSLIPEPSVSIFGKALSFSLEWGSKTSKKLSKTYQKDLATLKTEIEKYLSKLDKKILIIIDDIDRLNNVEIKQIFQLIKVLGNFPNTIYLTAMDKDVVSNALGEVQNGDGNEYMEKIINVPLEIPQLSKIDIDKYLFKKLDEILLQVDEKDFDQNYWGNIYHSGYKYFFTNIRDVTRYINILKFNYNALEYRVNIIDLMVITAFQIFEPEIYNYLKINKSLFSGQEYDGRYSDKNDNQKNLKTEIEKSSSLLQRLDKEIFIKLLQELFLKVKEAYTNTTYMGELSNLRKKSKLSSPEFYDAYFSLTLNTDLSNQEIIRIIDLTNNEEDFSNKITQLIQEKRISLFLNRFQDFTDNDIPKENFQVVFNVLMNLGDLIPENRTGMYSFGNSVELMRIFYQLYSQYDNENDKFKLFKISIEKATESIYMPCHEVSILMKQHGEYEGQEEKDEKVITKEQLQELKSILLEKINLWLKTHLLFEHTEALSIMYLWKRLDENQCLDYIKENTATHEKLLKFLQMFEYKSYSHTMGDYTERENQQFNYKALKDFINVEDIIADVRDIDSQLNALEQFCVDNFIGFYENRITNDDF